MIRAFFTILFLGVTLFASAQVDQKKQLEQKRAAILKEIQIYRGLLSKENKKEKSVLAQIADNEAKIALSEKLINNTKKQAKILEDEIYTNQLKINKLNRELKVLKEDYAEMLVKAYKSRSQQSRIMFILSSDNFLQAYKRMQYMKQYANYRKMQAEEIRAKKTELEALQEKLNAQKKEKEQLIAENLKVKKELEEEKKEQEKLIAVIKKDKGKYTADIKKKQQEAKEIDRQIDKIIKEAIAKANKKAASENKESTSRGSGVTAAPNKIVLTKEAKLVADSFKANKGKLPWPVEKGYMSMGYGTQPHPVYSHLEIHHSWIEITTEENANVRAIFKGTVLDVQIIAGTKSILVLHGDYISIYHNLSNVFVNIGDEVSLKQNIGTVYTNPNTGKTILKFMISQNTTRLNPQSWITPL
ncbi:peptidase M23 [Flavobacterium suaedae]|uniref:Peptidase M23 n=1 Tax=Flavobacterium suaedae TaxID=1767027 RepID=A0ABQ1JVG0_9FLAO|nr:peptidoglycan DD-metalloendopeptidase family protein [Flavobacterium suaedae]GGB77768.1 peptidase M23 [Flavobacterium suaedae]